MTQFPQQIVAETARQFGISRQAVSIQLRRLVQEGAVRAEGRTRGRRYALAQPELERIFAKTITPGLAEDQVWRETVEPLLRDAPPNVFEICHHGFTEIFNNVADHAEAANSWIRLKRGAGRIQLTIGDDGVGIFEKIRRVCRLDDHRHAILELAKGKLTTDPDKHTGEGIFFTSRMFDRFSILSGKLFFAHTGDDDWLIEDAEHEQAGTVVTMSIAPTSPRTTKEVFERYATEANQYGFTKTHVPVSLAVYGAEQLVSRSQAKRLLARFDRFKEVFLDFHGVATIGPAFADEIFRVFRREHPDVKLVWVRTTPDVEAVIHVALRAAETPPEPGTLGSGT